MNHFIQQGTPFVVLGTDLGLAPNLKLAYVMNDEAKGAKLAAAYLSGLLHGKGDIAIVGIYRHLKSSAERETSFEATINASAPGIRVLRRALEESTASQEQRQVETILRSTPHLQAIVALSSSSTRGAFYALQTSGLVGKVHLIGFDQDLLAPLASGGIDAVVMQDTRAMGQQAVRLMVDMIEGRQHSNKVVLSPILATQQNYTSKEVSRVLTRSWYEP